MQHAEKRLTRYARHSPGSVEYTTTLSTRVGAFSAPSGFAEPSLPLVPTVVVVWCCHLGHVPLSRSAHRKQAIPVAFGRGGCRDTCRTHLDRPEQWGR